MLSVIESFLFQPWERDFELLMINYNLFPWVINNTNKKTKAKSNNKTEEITIMWYRNKVKVLKKIEVLNWKLAKCFLVFMICISIEILGRFSEDVYFNGDKYILVKLNTWVELIGDRKQYLDLDTFNKSGSQRNELEQ